MQITPTTSANNSLSGNSATSGRNSVRAEDFYSLLIAQLQQQDPLKPTDNQAVLEQVSMIRQLESTEALNKTLGGIARQQELGALSSLIGRWVIGQAAPGAGSQTAAAGVVVGVRFAADGRAVLQLHNGQELAADRVREVRMLDASDAASPDGDEGASASTARTRSLTQRVADMMSQAS